MKDHAMTDQLDALRTSVVAAVQQELTRYNEMVSGEIQRLRAEVAAEQPEPAPRSSCSP